LSTRIQVHQAENLTVENDNVLSVLVATPDNVVFRHLIFAHSCNVSNRTRATQYDDDRLHRRHIVMRLTYAAFEVSHKSSLYN